MAHPHNIYVLLTFFSYVAMTLHVCDADNGVAVSMNVTTVKMSAAPALKMKVGTGNLD